MPDFTHFSPDWRHCLEHWLQAVKAKSGSAATLESYSNTLRRFFAYIDKAPDLITRADIASFLDLDSTSRRNKGAPISASTRNQRLTILNAFYSFASQYEILMEDGRLVPLFSRALPTVGMHAGKVNSFPRAMDESELARFFAAIPTESARGRRLHCLFYLYLLLGRRKMELVRLRWRDISPALLTGPNGEQRQGYVYHYIGKGDSRQVRTKELPLSGYQAICDLLESEGRLATIRPDDPVFANLRGYGLPAARRGQQMSGDYLSTQFHQIALEAGLDTSRLSLHSLRWSSALHRSQSGETVLAIRDTLDHQRLETTMHYLQRETSPTDAGAAALERKFSFLRRVGH